MTNVMTESHLRARLAARAFADGFARGADPRRARRRHVVDLDTHEHWLRGYDAGRVAAAAAESAYLDARLGEAEGSAS
jgi:hypothetical protein